MKRDLRNAAVAMEAYYASSHVYTSSVPNLTTEGLNQIDGVTLTFTVTSADNYTMTASRPNGSQLSFSYHSVTGVIQ